MSRVKIDIHADKSGFDSAMKSVNASISSLKSAVAGAFTVGAITGLITKTMEYAETIDKTSLRMKMTTEETQALSIMAQDAGSSLEAMENGFKKIEVARAKALGGDKKALSLFAQLGVGKDDLNKPNNTLGIASKLAVAARNGSTSNEGVALGELGLKKISGDLAALGDSFTDFQSKLDDLKSKGAIMSDEDIANMIRAGDEMEIFGKRVFAAAAPWISDFIVEFEDGWDTISIILTNTFAKLILKAQALYDFVMSLKPKNKEDLIKTGLMNTVTFGMYGLFKKDENGKSIINKAQDVGKAFEMIDETTKGSTQAEIDAKLAENEKRRAGELEARRLARLQGSGVGGAGDDDKPTKSKSAKIYSDNLTSVGNMLGASFRGIGQVTSLDIDKSIAANTKEIAELTKQMYDKMNEPKKDSDFVSKWNPI